MRTIRRVAVVAASLSLVAGTVRAGQPTMTVDPNEIDFGPGQLGSASQSQPVSIQNAPLGSPLSYSVSLTDGDTSDFLLLCEGGGDACLSGSVNAGQSKFVYVAFQATAVGPRAATLTVTGNDFTNPTETVALTGTGYDKIFSNGFEVTDATPWSQCVGCLDTDPPETIVDLAALSGGEPGSIDLSWTAPAEDSVGSSSCISYELRVSPSDITDENEWDNANTYPLLLTPAAPGNGQFLTATGLEPGQLYYFAIRAFDESANRGALGPSASAIATK